MADDRIYTPDRRISSSQDAEFGSNGFTRIADTKIYHAANGTDDGSNQYDGEEIGHYYKLVGIVNATFDTSGCAVAAGVVPGEGDPLNAGDVLYGKFTQVQLLGGTVYAYRARSKG
jgi:hypothetical protein